MLVDAPAEAVTGAGGTEAAAVTEHEQGVQQGREPLVVIKQLVPAQGFGAGVVGDVGSPSWVMAWSSIACVATWLTSWAIAPTLPRSAATSVAPAIGQFWQTGLLAEQMAMRVGTPSSRDDAGVG